MTPSLFRILEADSRLLRLTGAALADAARRAGEHLVCRPGCTQCCYGAFAIGPLDALRLRRAMDEMAGEDPSRAAAIAGRARRYLDEFEADFPGNPATGILGASEREQAAFAEFANDAACPALDPESGLCDLYAARPMTCRVFGPPVRARSGEEADGGEEALAVCELCFTQATPEEILAAEMQVPYAEEEAALALMAEAGPEQAVPAGDTLIAYCLTPMPARRPSPS